MAEITLKRKVTIRKKGESQSFTFSGRLKVKLFWSTLTDLDLCLFFKCKDGRIGGVFSDEYRQRVADLGYLNKFPYIQHMGDNKEPAENSEEVEQINIASLAELETAYVCIVNYNAALEQRVVTYAAEGGRIELQSDSGDYLEVLADSEDEGPIFLVCSIKNDNGSYTLTKESRVMDLGQAYNKIPGFALICDED